ncbi:hypothetical protein Mapa_012708 [Marchantia paleacea]|nr:hypothetical protein Mapa_012708 [Marchantia paleacea]
MDPAFARFLKTQCPPDAFLDFMALDTTNGTFDSTYYLDILTHRGLMESDVAILSDPLGVEYAIKAVRDPTSFLFEFGVAIIKMGSILTVDPYGWRKDCAFIKPSSFLLLVD